MRALLDVNVLITLLDADRPLHDASVSLDAIRGDEKRHLVAL